MVRWNKIGHFRGLNNYKQFLKHVIEANSPHTNSPQIHMVHKNPTKWPTQVKCVLSVIQRLCDIVNQKAKHNKEDNYG